MGLPLTVIELPYTECPEASLARESDVSCGEGRAASRRTLVTFCFCNRAELLNLEKERRNSQTATLLLREGCLMEVEKQSRQ